MIHRDLGSLAMAAPRRGPMLSFFWRLHRALYRVSGGRLGGRLGGFRTLLLTTTGRKSGRAVHVVLSYIDDGGDPVVVASNAGDERDPLWYANLKAHPLAEVRIGRETRRVRARTTIGDERERLWREFVARDAAYAEYQRRTARPIPVVVLERAGEAA
ncbi:MAG TPA: nitroreductase/quinone reductase family protein [Candidatus Dormibacteraeota bacterium]|nr:nitroreductase/quinone reductase family protein [Candidatus Dormibacteraeota bacterium]